MSIDLKHGKNSFAANRDFQRKNRKTNRTRISRRHLLLRIVHANCVYFAHDFMNAIKMFAFQFFLGNDRVVLVVLFATYTPQAQAQAHTR